MWDPLFLGCYITPHYGDFLRKEKCVTLHVGLLKWKLFFLRVLNAKFHCLLAFSINVRTLCHFFLILYMWSSLSLHSLEFLHIWFGSLLILLDVFKEFSIWRHIIQFWEMFFYYFFDNFHTDYFIRFFLLKLLLDFGPYGFFLMLDYISFLGGNRVWDMYAKITWS